MVVAFILLALLAPWVSPYSPTAANFLAVMRPPSPAHLLGTDELGRDILSRVISGARVSLSVGVVAVAIAILIGVPIGMVAGLAGGWTEELIMRVTDALLAFPFLIFALALAAILGPSLQNSMLAIGFASLPVYVRIARGQVVAERGKEYVQAAVALGSGSGRLLLRHLLPNIASVLLVQATLNVATAIIAEASLSFLGLGVQPPTPSWGSMLNTADNIGYLHAAPWMAVAPGATILIAVLAFNLLGDGLRDALDVAS